MKEINDGLYYCPLDPTLTFFIFLYSSLRPHYELERFYFVQCFCVFILDNWCDWLCKTLEPTKLWAIHQPGNATWYIVTTCQWYESGTTLVVNKVNFIIFSNYFLMYLPTLCMQAFVWVSSKNKYLSIYWGKTYLSRGEQFFWFQTRFYY